MKKCFFPLLLSFCFLNPITVFSQVQWASKVLEVSSERKQDPVGLGYQAIQALGAPNKMPAIGESPVAWCPLKKSSRKDEFIKVGFISPQQIRQIAVAENIGAGAVSQIMIYGVEGEVEMVYEDRINREVDSNSRMLRVNFPMTSFAVNAVKVTLSTIDIEGWNQIDAIGISGEAKPIVATINLFDGGLGSSSLLPSSINSASNEVIPVISPDGETLFFARKGHPENIKLPSSNMPSDDIWYATRIGSSWGNVKQMPRPLNNENHNYVASVTPDGNTLLLGLQYGANSTKESGVSISHRTGEGWGFPQKVMIDNYYNWSPYEEFSLGNGGKTLLVAALRKDSEGEKDLYASFKQEDGTWSEPKSLGSVVNTPADEASPFLASDQKTLYYASKGFSGYGDFDLYVTKRLDNTWENWSEPLNLGPIFNSSYMDVSLSIDARGEYAYFSSAKYDTQNNGDLFRAPLPEELKPDPVVLISGKVFNAQDSTPIGAKIIYEQLSTGLELGIAASATSSGEYKITLPLHEAYGFFAYAKGFLSIDDNIDLTAYDDVFSEIKRDLYLVPIEVGQVIRLNNIFFKRSEATLLPSSYSELKRLAKMLQAHPTMQIVLEGHTDIIGNPGKNMKLSKERVQVVKEYLVGEGVSSKRLDIKAFGGSRPLSNDRSSASQDANRRVEVRIVSL